MVEEGIQGGDRSHPRRRLIVDHAADQLGISVDAVRTRIKRRTIEHVREGGRVYVLLDADQDTTSHVQGGDQESAHTGPQPRARAEAQGELVESLLDQVAYMREQLAEEREARRRADMIIAQLTQANAALAQRVPELEPGESTEPRESPEPASEEAANTH